jgi:hypothetical protein
MTHEDIYVTLRDNDMIKVFETPPSSTPANRSKARGRGRPPKNPRRERRESEEEAVEGKEPKVAIPERYEIVPNRDVIDVAIRKYEAKGYLKLRAERLQYTPFLTTRDPIAPPPPLAAALVTGGRANGHGFHSDMTSSSNKEILSTPVDPDVMDVDAKGEPSTPDSKDRVVTGEDQATLDLVAALSASPTRHLRKRSVPMITSPERSERSERASKRRRSVASPVSRRHSLRGGDDLATPTRSHRKRPSVTPRKVIVEDDDDEEWGDEDAEGEDEDAEGEDDEEYEG